MKWYRGYLQSIFRNDKGIWLFAKMSDYGEISTEAQNTYCFGAVPHEDGRSGAKEYVTTYDGMVYEAALSSNKTSAGTDWTPGSDGIPSEFTTAPESSSDWEPVGG